MKTFSLTENQFSGKTYFYTIRPGVREDAEVSRVVRCGEEGRLRLINDQLVDHYLVEINIYLINNVGWGGF